MQKKTLPKKDLGIPTTGRKWKKNANTHADRAVLFHDAACVSSAQQICTSFPAHE